MRNFAGNIKTPTTMIGKLGITLLIVGIILEFIDPIFGTILSGAGFLMLIVSFLSRVWGGDDDRRN